MWVPRRVEQFFEAIISRLSDIQKSLDEQKHAIHHASQTAEANQREIPQVISRVVSAIEHSNEDVPAYEKTQRNKEYDQQNRLVIATWFTFGATFLAFLAAGIYAYIADRQLGKMDETYKEMRQQTPAIKQSAQAAADGVAAVQSQMSLDERPWLKIKFTGEDTPEAQKLDFQPGQPINLSIEIFNYGKTPALGIKGDLIAQFVPLRKAPDIPDSQEHGLYRPDEVVPNLPHRKLRVIHEVSVGMINADSSGTYSLNVMRRVGAKKLIKYTMNSAELAELRTGKVYLSVWGQLWYNDIFGIDHWTKFCNQFGYVIPNNDKCAAFNDTDRNYRIVAPTRP